MKKNTTIMMFLGLAAMAGCSNSLDAVHSRMFDDTGIEETRTLAVAKAQVDAATVEDAMLQPSDFTGKALNTSGTDKLAALLPNDNDSTATVYINTPAGDLADARKKAVSAFFSDNGVSESRVKLEIGENPNQHSPTGVGIAALEQMNSPTAAAAPSNSVSTSTAAH